MTGTPSPKPGAENAYEKAVLALRADPGRHQIVRKNYLDEDFEDAARRYQCSDEFSTICALLEPYFGPGSTILDLGAGRGLTSLALVRRGARVVSLEEDPSPVIGISALARAIRDEPVRPLLCRGDALHLPFMNATFDVVFCRSVLHHFTNLQHGLNEAQRVLKPAGVFLAANEHVISPFSRGDRFREHHPCVAYGVDERAYSAFAYRRHLRRAGFAEIRLLGDCSGVLSYSRYRESVGNHPRRAYLVGLPVLGPGFLRLAYGLHVLAKQHLRHLFVSEEGLPVISMAARKPSRAR